MNGATDVVFELRPIPMLGIGKLGLTWIARWRYKDIPLGIWIFAVAHDESSYWLEDLGGLEINWRRDN